METKRKIIEALWQANAIKTDYKSPFILTSGSLSPIYIDCRLLISDPEARELFIDLAEQELEPIDFDLIAGGATAGIPFASFLAQELEHPLIYVRKEPKGHGKAAQIEGLADLDGKEVLLVEDLITYGNSKLKFVGGIERAGGNVNHCLVLFDRQQNGEKNLKEHGIELMSLVTLDEALSYGLKEGEITQEEFEEIREYLEDPEEWEVSFKGE